MRLLLASLFLSAPLCAQSTWYVDVHGTPPGSGTPSDPYTSIQYAIDRPTTHPGDTLLVFPGTYAENVVYHGKSIAIRSARGPAATVIDGGGADSCVRILNGESAGAVLEGFTLTGGHAFEGGGLRTDTSSPTVRGCVITGNVADARGAGVFAGHGSPSFSRCAVVRNDVAANVGYGGGLYALGASLSVDRCSFTQNSAGVGSGLAFESGGAPTVANTIVWDNVFGVPVWAFQVVPSLRYCDVQGNYAGSGNFDADPKFWNPIARDLHLKPGSPCIDAGDPASPADPDGSIADVGAYVFDPAYCGAPGSFCFAKTNSQGCTPAIDSIGSPSATSPSPFWITASDVLNNKTGLLIYGYGPDAAPFQGGTLCVASPLRRTSAQNSGGHPPPNDCSGTFSFDFNARIRSGVDARLVPAATVYAQYYYRDPAASFHTGLTDGLAFTICP